jgi:Glycosyl hydrolase family 12
VKLRVAAVAAVVFALLMGGLPALASGGSGSGPVGEQTICGLNRRVMQNASGGVRVISRPNPFGSTWHLCVQLSGKRPGFRITTNVRFTGQVQAYPFTGVGCAYDLCSRGTNLPKRVSKLSPRIESSWTWRGSTNGFWNASYDIWFDSRDQITTQDNGAELMIWLRTPPGYRVGRLVYVRGVGWFMYTHWLTGHKQCDKAGRCYLQTWQYIQFRFLHTTHSVRRLRLLPFIQFAIGVGLIRPSWWLTSVHAGYELWSGGRGLSTTWFNART